MNTKKIKIGIIGGAGYTAGELLRLLLHHPFAQIEWVQSNSQAGKRVSTIHRDLYGDVDWTFVQDIHYKVDVVFLCAGHGRSLLALKQYDFEAYPIKIIDLSSDFRMASAEHHFVYGLPELNALTISSAQYIANPGCFATAIQLALLPLAQAQLLQHKDIYIQAITGATGAGQQPSSTSHFSWRQNNVSIYKPFVHQHLPEIQQSLQQVAPSQQTELHFIPIRGNFCRGIFASICIDMQEEEAFLSALFQDYYKDSPFVKISTQNPDLKQVINSNKCLIYLHKHNNKLLLVSLLDNLLKGASGQAIQNMNLLFDLPQTTGLTLKATAF